MTPLIQTKVSNAEETVHGNCLRTCIASLLDCAIDDIPPFEDMGDDWHTPFFDFLFSRGYTYRGTRYVREGETWGGNLGRGVGGLFIVAGDSPRGFKRGHSVICDTEGNLVHDPHPSGLGVPRVRHIYMIEPKAETAQ